MKLLFALWLIISISGAVLAGDATFTQDAKTIYALPRDPGNGLWKIEVATGKAELIDLPMELGKTEVLGLARSSSGQILLTTAKEVWTWDLAKGKATKMLTMEEDSFTDIACLPDSGSVIMTPMDMEAPYFALKDWKTAGRMFTRRADGASKFAFDGAGNAFFAIRGDLWAGTLSFWDDEEKDVPKNVETREEADQIAHTFGPDAARVVALGALQTNSSNQRNVLIGSVAVSTKRVYVWVGHNNGAELLSLPKQPMADLIKAGASENLSDAASFLKVSSTLLAGMKAHDSVGHSGKPPWLCASPDGHQIFTRGEVDDTEAVFLITDDGEPKKLAGFEGE